MTDSAINWRSYFSLPEGLLYFNSANLSFLPSAVRRAIAEHQNQFESNPTEGLRSAWGKLSDRQKALGAFLNAAPENLFFRANITSVLNTMLMGIPLEAGDEILMGALEYGAIQNICRLRAKRENLSVRMIRFPTTAPSLAGWTPSRTVSEIDSQLGPRTKVLLLSHVIGAYGLLLPIDDIGKRCREKGIHLVVDGAYAVGAVPVDFRQLSHIDFYGGSLYKWMLGPKGTAFGYVSPEGQKLLQPTSGGWKTFDGSFSEKFSLSGCHDFSPFFAISELLDFWRTFGEQKIRDRIQHLSRELQKGLEDLNVPLLLPPEPSRTAIVSARIPKRIAEANPVHLGSATYYAFSPHIYNSEEEVDNLLCEVRRIKFSHS